MKLLKLNPSNAYFYAVINWYLKLASNDEELTIHKIVSDKVEFHASIRPYIRLFYKYSKDWLAKCSYCALYRNNNFEFSCIQNGGCPLKPEDNMYGCQNGSLYAKYYINSTFDNAKAILFQIFDTCPKVKLTKRQDEIVNEIKRLYNYENKETIH